MSASGSAGPRFDTRRNPNFYYKNFKPRARRARDRTSKDELNSKPFRSIYVEKAFCTVDNYSSVGGDVKPKVLLGAYRKE